ncbi:hypothetical protein GYB22_04700 [bacterium]|nr:hypothetical protein [bacterium]
MTKKFKYEKNWQSKTLENLEKEFWGEPDFNSSLVTTCHALRKKPLNQFSIEDLRIMIGQNFSLNYIIPLALNILKNNVLVEGDLYEGDLLLSVMKCDKEFWQMRPDLKEEIEYVLSKHAHILANLDHRSIQRAIEAMKY